VSDYNRIYLQPECCGEVWVTDGNEVWASQAFMVEEDSAHFWKPTGLTRPQPPQEG